MQGMVCARVEIDIYVPVITYATKYAVILKVKLKSNCKHVPADSIHVASMQNSCERRKCYTYWGGGDRKNLTGTI